jgi:hypothetical protein
MGEYFLIVNPAKRQYIDAFHFGESIKFNGILRGKHATALALLICDEAQAIPPLGGTWAGDPLVVTGDSAPANTAGVTTATSSHPDRNLYRLAQEEFENISLQMIAMLCERDHTSADEFAERARTDKHLLAELGEVVFQIGCPPLQAALKDTLGSDWTKHYKEARTIAQRQ